eukprot:9107253-Pyramimonas_sp.AAC.1
MPRVMMVRKSAAPQVTALWRTGLLPAAAHGASVSGVSELELAKLRRAAGVICGRSASSASLTLVLATQKDEMYDP